MPMQQTGLAVAVPPHDHGDAPPAGSGPAWGWRGAGALLWRAGQGLLRWQQRVTERAHLATLSDHCLRDVGLTPADMRRALTRPARRGRS